MSVYLQFDSLARSDPYIIQGDYWVPNDNFIDVSGQLYQTNKNLIQCPSNYKVYYKQLNDTNNLRTIGFLEHCKEKINNLNFSVESCVLIVPASGLFPRTDCSGNITYVSVLDEPYLYVRMMPIDNAEGDLIYSNNPPANEATFIVWIDKIQFTNEYNPPKTSFTRPNIEPLNSSDIVVGKWVTYKSCMITVMRLNLAADEWQIRIFDRYGNTLILAESIDCSGNRFPKTLPPPKPNPNLQTMLLVGIKPNYPL